MFLTLMLFWYQSQDLIGLHVRCPVERRFDSEVLEFVRLGDVFATCAVTINNRIDWDIPNVKSNHSEKTIHPCQFPIELVERCVLALTDENDWVLDPYSGVGSALIAGLKQNRRVIGVEKEHDYIEIAKKRICDFTLRRVFSP